MNAELKKLQEDINNHVYNVTKELNKKLHNAILESINDIFPLLDGETEEQRVLRCELEIQINHHLGSSEYIILSRNIAFCRILVETKLNY